MRATFGNDHRRIDHALKVLGYAEQIGQEEPGDPLVITAAAILHDIGIQAAERTHGSSAGRFQEIEGPPIARAILTRLGVDPAATDHVCPIVASHHNARDIDTPSSGSSGMRTGWSTCRTNAQASISFVCASALKRCSARPPAELWPRRSSCAGVEVLSSECTRIEVNYRPPLPAGTLLVIPSGLQAPGTRSPASDPETCVNRGDRLFLRPVGGDHYALQTCRTALGLLNRNDSVA
jgi:hypothetical protein